MAIANTNIAPLLAEGTNITLTQDGQVITIDSTGGGGGTPGGSDTQVQFNDGGSFGGDAGLTYDKTNNVLDLESIDFATTPTAADATGRLHWDNDEGSLVLTLKGGNLTIPIGQEVTTLVYNAEATTLTKGEVVYAYGASGQRVSVKRAVNTGDSTSAQTVGVVAESIASGAEGFVMVQGMVRGINTSAYTQGDAIYLGSSAGTFTKTKPYAPNHLVYIGFVVKVHASAGEIFVKVQNGYEMDELHNVSAQSPSNNDILAYNTSTSLWEKKQLTAIGGVTGTGTTNELTYWTGSTAIASLTTATYPSLTELSYVKGVTSAIQTQLNARPTGSGTSGQIAYWNGTSIITGESNLYWDASNDRLGIGTNSPSYNLDVNGTARVSQTSGTVFLIGTTSSSATSTPTCLSLGGITGNNSAGNTGNLKLKLFDAANTTTEYGLGISSGLMEISAHGNIGFYAEALATRANRMMIFASTGNISIGTATDNGYKLYINGTGYVNGALDSFTTHTISSTASFTAKLNLKDRTAVSSNVLSTGSATVLGTGGMVIETTTNHPIVFRTNSSGNETGGNERIRIFEGGNIGINTGSSNGGFKLDINGTARVQDNLTISDAKNVILGTTTGTKIGTSTSQKIGFYNATPIVQPTAVTTSQGIANALSSLGLLASSSISSVPDVGGKLYLFNSY